MKLNLRLLNVHIYLEILNNAVRQNVIDQVNLRDLDPILHKKYKNGEILIVGAVYDIHTGKSNFYKKRYIIYHNLRNNVNEENCFINTAATCLQHYFQNTRIQDNNQIGWLGYFGTFKIKTI
jgi:hypothetical protein